ncbi:MAG: GTP-sensing pleiotropic transcriptional regulator CodY [Clostridiales bacterium]|nr:GTP-sensing pleiotropic transcriptional regulator CodY [Clostridiales bacterium]MBQ3107410.1 GTP-sensing pleiotropic transcriptional regulator CodY [Bacillota bacterium]MBQ9930835.1 GTP-sensing pleiotropic transcriptional regulator CodY [Bacillota bacterium]
MGLGILEKVRKLNWVLQESSSGIFSFDDLCRELGGVTMSNVYILNRRGKILGAYYQNQSESAAIVDPETGIQKFPAEYNDALLKVEEPEVNLTADDALKIFKYEYDTSGKVHTIVPIVNDSRRLGTLILARYAPEYGEEDLVLAEYGATVVGLEIRRRNILEEEQKERQRSMVRMALDTLSYSEAAAIQQIFAELNGTEGLLIASKIADRSGITRSVIVNALRKLESAGVIETRSLGMKGTHIKVLNDCFMEELKSLDR